MQCDVEADLEVVHFFGDIIGFDVAVGEFAEVADRVDGGLEFGGGDADGDGGAGDFLEVTAVGFGELLDGGFGGADVGDGEGEGWRCR